MKDASFFYTTPAGQRGPVSLDGLRGLVRSGAISADSPIWCEAWPDWRRVADCAQSLALPVAGVASVYSADPLPRRESLRSRVFMGCFVAALVALLALGVARVALGPHPFAYAAACDAVRAQLKAPASAVFTSSRQASYRSSPDGLQIAAFVDSQNAFGATLRSQWRATVGSDGAIRSVAVDSP